MAYGNLQDNPANAIPVWVAGATTAHNITTEATTTWAANVFAGLNVNTAGTASTAKVYDGTDNTGVLLGTFDTTKTGATGVPIQLASGHICVVTAGSAPADVTVATH